MTDDPTTPGPALEPTPPRPEGEGVPGVPPTTGAVPPPPPAGGIPATEMTAATPPGAPPPKGPSWKTWVAVAGGAVVVGAAAVFGISAATSSGSSNANAASQQPVTNTAPNGQAPAGEGLQRRFAGRGAFGTITSIDGSTLTVSDRQQGTTTKVATTSKTKVTTSAKGSSSDVKVGDTVMVVGTKSGSSIAARRVSDEGKVSASDQPGPGGGGFGGRNGGFAPPQGGEGFTPPQDGQGGTFTPPQGGQGFDGTPPQGGFPGGAGANGMSFTRGEVQSVSDGSFTVKGIDGTSVTVTTSTSTTFTVTKDASVSDLKVGDSIVATGRTENGVLTATRIREGNQAGGFFAGGRGFPGAPNRPRSSGSSTSGPQ